MAAGRIASQRAPVATFNPLIGEAQGNAGDGMTYSEAGLTFSSSVGGRLSYWGSAESFSADPDGATLYQPFAERTITVTRTGSGSFFLNAFDLADAYDKGAATVLPFSYVDIHGDQVGALTLDALVGLHTFTVNMEMTSFMLTQRLPGGFQLDNVRFDDNPVPEPSTLVLLCLALAGAQWVSRRALGQH